MNEKIDDKDNLTCLYSYITKQMLDLVIHAYQMCGDAQVLLEFAAFPSGVIIP